MDRASASEDLAWIRSLMDESQRFISGTWRHQLVWGLLGAVGLLGTWLSLRAATFTLIPWVWGVVVAAGWTYSLVLVRHGGDGMVRNVSGRAFGAIWMALGVTLTLLGAVTIATGAIDPKAMPGLISIVFGAGYFASGHLAGLRWLAGIGVAWWVGGLALLLWAHPDAILVLAGMTLVLQAAPALVMRNRERSLTTPD